MDGKSIFFAKKVQWNHILDERGEIMHKKRLSAFLLGSTAWLLVACQSPATETTTTEAATSTSQVQSDSQATSQAASRASSLDATESVQAQTPSTSSTNADPATTTDTAQTTDEATLIAEAKQTITQLTGYVESDVYLFIVESVEGNEVTINVRENGTDVASSVGFYRYNGTTGELLEMDVVTGEYTRHPAQY
jgi:cytoskeletal protein RodZ